MTKGALLVVFLAACGGSSAAVGDEFLTGSAEWREPVADVARAEPVEVDAGAPAREDASASTQADGAPQEDAPDAGSVPAGPVPFEGSGANPTCQSFATRIATCEGAGVPATWAFSSTCNGAPWRYVTANMIEFRAKGREGCGVVGSVACCVN